MENKLFDYRNLFLKHQNDETLLKRIDNFKSFKNIIDTHPTFKVDDMISFWGGHNDDIRYTSKIIGFDDEGGIYVVWDCYWAPIKNDKRRQIEKIK